MRHWLYDLTIRRRQFFQTQCKYDYDYDYDYYYFTEMMRSCVYDLQATTPLGNLFHLSIIMFEKLGLRVDVKIDYT